MKRLIHFVVFLIGIQLIRPNFVAAEPNLIGYRKGFRGPTVWHFAIAVVFIALSGLALGESHISLKNTKWPNRRRLVLCIFWLVAAIVFAVCAVILPMLYL